MPKLSDKIKKAKKSKEIKETFKDLPELKEKLNNLKENGKTFTLEQTKSPFLDVLESDKITIDEARAYYIVICKKKPKHDSIQTKNFLINEIKRVLDQSKTN